MPGNTVRIGDTVSCGDHAAAGSPNVFANGLPVSHGGARATTGHGCFHPTVFAGPFSTTVFVNSQPVVLRGRTQIVAHRCGKAVHGGTAVTGSLDVYVES